MTLRRKRGKSKKEKCRNEKVNIMYQMDFNKPEHVHFIGIGGISMSGLAEILMDEGFTVSGSDAHPSELTEKLEHKGAAVFYGQRAENITDGIDVVVYTAAIHPDNPELAEARAKGLPILTRAELLGQMMRNYRYAIGIAGTHGKTTTTSMVAEILMAADTDPTVTVGGILNSIGGNIRLGGSEMFVAEACEYTNSFLSFYPNREIILNIEEDHLDFFKDIDDIRASFRRFAQIVPADGVVVISADIDRVGEIVEGLPCRVVTYGRSDDAQYRAENIEYDEYDRASFDAVWTEAADNDAEGGRGMEAGKSGAEGSGISSGGNKAETGAVGDNAVARLRIRLSVPGEHNIYNALAAIALCRTLSVGSEAIRRGLAGFTGTNRRFEKKGEVCGLTIIDDYAHHPQEIAATLSAAKHYPHKKLWCVFQPHTYTRTKAFLDQFAEALSAADEVILADIYAARETDTLGISSGDIAERIEALGTPAHYLGSFDEIEKFILENCVNGDLLITMGAGDIVKVGENLLGI